MIKLMQRNLTDMETNKSVVKIHILMKQYMQKLRHIWEEYSFIRFYGPHLHKLIKHDELPPYEFTPFHGNSIQKKTKQNSISAVDQVLKNSIDHRVLLDSVSFFENYVCELARVVYLDYPKKLITNDVDSETGERRSKLLATIVNSASKEEMIESIIEEKLRSIFYGKPTDILTKDKLKLEISDNFSSVNKGIISEYEEITARRNIVVHNNGMVDNKYIKETKNVAFKLNSKIPIDNTYLKNSLAVLEGIAALISDEVIKNIYKSASSGKLANALRTYNNTKSKYN